ncbi:hypothetical protein BRARA_I03752 [Brassica rapa]|uniref:FBD domain-containing protein n=1 Tax=Brassica campestris TaxID=3711 RepID=A0A397Y0H3_BRACM|nr:hypothetical protein BRARA_I03752 [Brassica rapa]RID47132.1 hypothetical protein BRARA_I03752 [Brassica rapa]
MDRISELSDELLVKMLLVPTKVALSTSILSKRWEYLWMWLPKLKYEFRGYPEPEGKMLLRFLDRNLPLHRAPVIERFRLDFRYSPRLKPESISMWVSTALSHCLRELDISRDSCPAEPNIFPSNLYTCISLVILKLEGGFLLDVPGMVSLPSLKTLKLQGVRYFDDEALQRLLSNCPVLEVLVVVLSNGDTTGKLTVVVPSLLSLSLYLSDYLKIDGYVIDTPSLKYFKLDHHTPYDNYCLIEKMPHLIEAAIDVNLPDMKSLTESITSVKHLTICSKTMLDKGCVFSQLEHLEVCLCREHSSNQLVRLLKSSSNLQELHLFFTSFHCIGNMGYWNQPTTVPECLLSSLQRLRWSKYTGDPQERDLVVYILKNALHLKTATIEPYELDVPKFEMLKELELSSRASAVCQLMFECTSED